MTSIAGIAREPLETPSTWLGPELRTNDDWNRRLTPEQIADLKSALAAAKASGKPMTELTRNDFPLPVLGPAIAEWIQSLQSGRGFINVMGIPVAEHDEEDDSPPSDFSPQDLDEVMLSLARSHPLCAAPSGKD